jgi:hypothetical protein
MATYRSVVTAEIREIPAELYAAWQAVGNPKAGAWEPWEVTSPPPPPPDPAPDWGGFLRQLLQSPMLGAAQLGAEAIIGAELPTANAERTEQLLKAVNALTSLTSGLAVASLPSGDSGLFEGAWLLLREASLVAPEIAAAMAQLAAVYHIPQSLIDSLGAPSEPS